MKNTINPTVSFSVVQNKYSIFNLTLILAVAYFIVGNVSTVNGQNQLVKGRITEFATKEPIPFANVYFKKSLQGTVSDINGAFQLNLEANDSLVISAVGFKTKSIASKQLRGKTQHVRLKKSTIKIKEVRIKPRKTRSHELLKLIHKNEKLNNTYYFKGFEGDEYSRTSIRFTGLDKKIMEKGVFKNTKGAFMPDTDSTCSLPVLMEENINYFLVPKDGSERSDNKVLTKKNTLDVFEGADMDDITKEMTHTLNFYRQYIPFLGKNFASPAAINARFYYRLWVSDSIMVGNRKVIRIDFRPRRPKDLAFNGYFWVEDSTYAITEMYVEMSTQANINYIRGLKIHNTYEKNLGDKYYYKSKKADLIIDYTPGTDTLKKVMTHITKVSSYKNLKFTDNNFVNEELLTSKKPNVIGFQTQELEEEYWQNTRFIAMDSTEQTIYASIDSLKTNKLVQVFDKSLNMFLTGYLTQGWLDIGPYLDFYRKNKIEGKRFTFAFRTSKEHSLNYTVGGFLGYGLRNNEFKYGAKYRYNFNRKKYTIGGLDAWYDIKKLGDNENLSLVKENSYSSGDDNIVAALTAIKPNDKLSEKRYAGIWMIRDLRKGITSKFKVFASKTSESPYVPFLNNGNRVAEVNQLALSSNIRFSFKETHMEEYFRRVYFGNRFPIVNLYTEAGYSQTTYNETPYIKLHATVKHKLRLGMGYFRYLIEAGKIYGKVPFTMLEVHRGNETFGMARFNFNMLNYMEYLSDEYINLHSYYNFGGVILNYLPLIRRLNLREVVSFKAIVGNLNNKHNDILTLPAFSSSVTEPYAEVGVGITNIGQYGRLEYVWRLSDRDKPDITLEGLRFRFEVSF